MAGDPSPRPPAPQPPIPARSGAASALQTLTRTARTGLGGLLDPAPDSALRRLLGPALLLIGTAFATWSVVRFQLQIVFAYLVLVIVLAVALIRTGAGVRLDRLAGAGALGLAGLLAWIVPGFSYLPVGQARIVHLVMVLAALLAALVVLLPLRRGPDLALAIAVIAYVTVAVIGIRFDPAPKIDVWYTLQGAADGLARGQDAYRLIWVGPPGVMRSFTYLPWMGVLLAPGRWLLGDVRWTLTLVTVAAALALRALPSRALPAATAGPNHARPLPDTVATGAVVGALLLLLPGTATQAEQAWTEPLLLACLAGAALALVARRSGWAVVLLALGLASKQHLALLLPLLAAWPRFGWRRTGLVAGLAGLLVLPWLVWDFGAIWHDAVAYLVDFPPIRFADTLYIAARHSLHWTPPFWLTGLIVLACLGAVTWVVRHRNPDLGEFLRWAALVLFVANLVNKQAFYNQFWLVAALVLASWAVPRGALTSSDPAAVARDESDPVRASRALTG